MGGLLKVAARSNFKTISGAIAGAIEEHGVVEIHAIGAGTVNQTIKTIAIARRFIKENGVELKPPPGFMELQIDGERKTGIRFIVER
jgi:stage V sporulation protein S